MSYKLEKPYSEKEKTDFIVEYNHNQGLEIKETSKALYALEAWETLKGDKVIDNTESYNAEQAQKERERIAMLSLTAADVERAIYKAKDMDFEDILEMVSQLIDNPSQPSTLGEGVPAIDIKALKIELKANNFYRGNPYIEQVGALLGFTPQMLDEFFETNDYTKLMPTEENNSAGQASDTSSNDPARNKEVEE